jgi:hypothetical protein
MQIDQVFSLDSDFLVVGFVGVLGRLQGIIPKDD